MMICSSLRMYVSKVVRNCLMQAEGIVHKETAATPTPETAGLQLTTVVATWHESCMICERHAPRLDATAAVVWVA